MKIHPEWKDSYNNSRLSLKTLNAKVNVQVQGIVSVWKVPGVKISGERLVDVCSEKWGTWNSNTSLNKKINPEVSTANEVSRIKYRINCS